MAMVSALLCPFRADILRVNIEYDLSGSEVLAIQDAVALPENLVSLGSKMELLSQIAHIEKLLVVLLQ